MTKFKILHIWGKDRYDGGFESLIVDPNPDTPVTDYLSPGDIIEDYEIVDIDAKWTNIPSSFQFNRIDL